MSRGLTEIKGCFSGVLARKSRTALMRHLAMATEPALQRLCEDNSLKTELAALYKREKIPTPYEINDALAQGNFSAEIYGSRVNWLTFGIYTEEAGDAERFRQALSSLSNREAGIHRDVFWSVHGIKIGPELIACQPGQYGRAIHKLFEQFGDKINQVIEFKLTNETVFFPAKRTKEGLIIKLSWTSIKDNFEQEQRFPLPLEAINLRQHLELI